jgi:hypothetical protein
MTVLRTAVRGVIQDYVKDGTKHDAMVSLSGVVTTS